MVRSCATLLPWLWLLWPGALAMEWFDVTRFRDPMQCERQQCLSVRLEYCRNHLEGFYLREKGCAGERMCTDCAHGNSTVPAVCYCENKPYSVTVEYGQQCGMGKECSEGICYRPCHTFMHLTTCPEDYCKWESETKTCEIRPDPLEPVLWLSQQDGPPRPPAEEGGDVVILTTQAAFPMSFDMLRHSATGYRIQSILIDDLTTFEALFLELDVDINGVLDQTEYAELPTVLSRLEVQAIRQIEEGTVPWLVPPVTEPVLNLTATAEDADSEGSAEERRLFNETITPETCSGKRPREYFCSFDMSCKLDCRTCGWKSATDAAFSICVAPNPLSCYADGFKVYCDSDRMCHEPGDCSNCVDRPIVDHSQHKCVQIWWEKEPLTQMKDWVCRDRNKNGMPCRHDQDCIHGMRRCIYGECMSFQPYNVNQTCVTDLDCPHIDHYCPADPTGGKNKYWVQYCRVQSEEMMTCTEDRECKPDMRCNTADPQPRCRRLFSLPFGALAVDDVLCEFGWRDRNFKCAPPAKSKKLGRPCDSNLDCATTDMTGRVGECVCKQWWDEADARYCEPVAGDFRNHQENLRNYWQFRSEKCGTFWNEEECLRVFGSKFLILKLEVECERQQLVGGAYLPHEDCGLQGDDRFPDHCARLKALKR